MGDPVTHFITWNWPTVYGPVWTRIEIAVVGLLHAGSLWPQVVALKLAQAGALVGMALAGRRIAAHLCPGRENLTLLALGLNPMLLLEGPGSGHNDLLLVCLLLVGAMFYLDKKYLPAALCLGLSVGIKLITLAVLPWALMEYGRGRPGRQKLAAIGVAVALVLLPLAICYGHLWSGGAALTAMQARSLYHLSADALAQNAQMETWLRAHGPRSGDSVSVRHAGSGPAGHSALRRADALALAAQTARRVADGLGDFFRRADVSGDGAAVSLVRRLVLAGLPAALGPISLDPVRRLLRPVAGLDVRLRHRVPNVRKAAMNWDRHRSDLQRSRQSGTAGQPNSEPAGRAGRADCGRQLARRHGRHRGPPVA